ncbi:MAG: class I SAM-dependent methyltransferase [Patescibacteria group bacterium]|nr:class I SAM-dependent methyltransferase [Patescibacteria group bacterium]
MTREYWDKKHTNDYSRKDWADKASIFSVQVVKFFPRTGNILEIGTGQGGDANYFQSLGYTVTATDYSGQALESAKSKVDNVKFVNIDTANGLPFPDETFDVVYSHMALHYFDKETTRKVFEDIHRILKSYGILATITNTGETYKDEIKTLVRYVGRKIK